MKNRRIAVLMFAAVLALAGCGSSDETASTPSSGVSSAASSENETSQTESAESGTVTSDAAPIVEETLTAENIDDFISLAEYKNLKINAPEGTLIADGMVANIDYVGSIDGVEFDGGTGTGYDLEIGSDTFIDGFEDQLIGHKEGDEVDVEVTFPEDYASEDLAGQDALFAVTINKVYYQSPQTAFDSVVDASTVLQYPSEIIDAWADAYIDSYNAYVTAQGTESSSLSEISTVKELAEVYGTTEDELTTAFETNAKGSMVAQAIMAKEGVTRESEGYTSALEDLLSQNGYASVDEALEAGAMELQIEYLGDVLAAEGILVQYEAEE